MSARGGIVAGRLYRSIENHAEPNSLGMASVEVLYELAPRLKRRPDVAFVTRDRWPHNYIPDMEGWKIIPSIAAEVISKSNSATDVVNKISEYFRHGVLEVWEIYPNYQEIRVHRQSNPSNIQVLRLGDTLTGGEIIPGFELALEELFAGTQQPTS